MSRLGGVPWHTTRVTALKLPGLPFALEPEGSPPPGCRVRHGVLTLTAGAGTDLFVDPAGAEPGQVPDAGRLVGLPPPGDFTLAAQVTVEFGSMYDAGVLLLHAARRQWAGDAWLGPEGARPRGRGCITNSRGGGRCRRCGTCLRDRSDS